MGSSDGMLASKAASRCLSLLLIIWLLTLFTGTEQGHCGACRRKWRLTDTDLCPCGEIQTMSHIVESCPRENWMAAYLCYALQMKTLLRGWPIMVHDTHTRRRRQASDIFDLPLSLICDWADMHSYVTILTTDRLVIWHCKFEHRLWVIQTDHRLYNQLSDIRWSIYNASSVFIKS